MEDAGNNVEVDESLFQEMDDLELEDNDDDPDYNPADRERDLTDWWTIPVCREAWLPLCWEGVDFPFFFLRKKKIQENILLMAFIIELNKFILKISKKKKADNLQ